MGFGFHEKMIKWVMACVASTSFSLAINGNLYGFFKGKRGLRQGDPMSPYLFTLVMEVLTLVLQKQVCISNDFRFHSKCEKQRIVNLCFADDLFLFARGDNRSAKIIMEALNMFKNMSGLVPSMAKSTVFFCNVSDEVKQRILAIMPFEEGSLPVRYLGVPLISSRLHYKDCKQLVERMETRITDWKTKCLSFAGRLQLIRSVLSSLHIYWASVFILPKRLIVELENKMKRFLWAQGDSIKGKAKVKWRSVCRPKCEGGLGIRRVGDMNNALMTVHAWSVLTHRESLWVKWIHTYRLRGRSFWEIPSRGNMTWSWRKMLNLRLTIRNHVWTVVGNGADTSAWFDKWDDVCPIHLIVTPRLIANAGFNMKTKVADVCCQEGWRWPSDWIDRFPVLANLSQISLVATKRDNLVWKNRSGMQVDFSTSAVWDDIRNGQDLVPWNNAIWFPQAIPRHAFIMWLIVNKKLKTQDVMSRWNSSGNANYNLLCCSLCISGPDSHEHLFFECSFGLQIWNGVKVLAGMEEVCNKWDSIYEYLVRFGSSKSARIVIGKLVVGATAYFVWQERIMRLFSTKKRSASRLVEIILETVRMKLHTMRFKRTGQVERILQDWSLPRGLLFEEDDCG
ncbi:putative RNA-directed DNA polymerase [Helianthus annuus]|nr:putative RNA-directed DNA polymerase [Helianthus annuus]